MRIVAGVLTTVLVAATALTAAGPAAAASEAGGGHNFRVVAAHGEFGEFEPGANAVTYQPDLVPVDSKAHVLSVSSSGFGTTTWFAVAGLVPNREYGAHAHTNACGATGNDAGPHYQNVQDPVSPSVDPAYANPRNEIWLDFTTNAHGRAHANSKVDWQFGERRAKSIVIHETHTHTDPGHAGMAGARLACLNVDY
ncbi:superoxide dismutase [Amycolatopsis anabasis]|uniref:superoxide dismutase n=1 Tax=Amycolatopsis anabasis TaxID=1840409 RepID=UPI00131D6F0C|nr:superoxide dismutase [Amycolatopsis anabasis]